MLQVQQHDHAELGRHAGQCDEADAARHREMMAEGPQQPDTARQGKRQRGHDQRRFVDAFERQVQQHKDDEQRGRDDDLELCRRPLQVFELSGPGHGIAGRQFYFPVHCLLHGVHGRAQVASADIDVHPARQPRVLAFQHRRTVVDLDRRHVTQPYLGAALGQYRQVAQFFHRIAHLARITDIDRKALQAFHRLADIVAADCT